jgi:DNA-binding MarR family transcriptional regulator
MTDHSISKSQYEAIATFRYEMRRYLRFSEELTRKAGITPLQYQLLLQIKGFPGRDWAKVSELAERLQAKHHGVVALISRCEELGLAQRKPNSEDRRCIEVHLSPKGERLLKRLVDMHRTELLALRGRFRVPDVQSLSSGVKR